MAGYLGRQEDKSNQREKCGRNFTCVASAGTLPHKLTADVVFLQHGRVSHPFEVYETDITDRIVSVDPAMAIANRKVVTIHNMVSPGMTSSGSTYAVSSARVIFQS